MAVFFRVENESGRGMYCAADGLRGDVEHNDPVRRPTPWHCDNRLADSAVNDLPSDWRYGFKTLDSMAEWIASLHTLSVLIGRGFRIGVYVIDQPCHYVVGRCQVRFGVRYARRRGHLDLETIRAAVTLENNDDQ